MLHFSDVLVLLMFTVLFVCRLTLVQNCMKLSGTIEMTVGEFFVNLTFVHQREGLLLSSIIDSINFICTLGDLAVSSNLVGLLHVSLANEHFSHQEKYM